MDGIRVCQTSNGWVYEVCFKGRTVVLGCCPTLDEAMQEASSHEHRQRYLPHAGAAELSA